MQLRLWWRFLVYRWTAVTVVVGLYLLTFCVILPISCRNLLHSQYYVRPNETELIMRVNKENYARFEDAQLFTHSIDFINNLRTFVTRYFNDPKSPEKLDLAIGIVTTNRDNKTAIRAGAQQPLGYLTQTVVQLVKASRGNRPLDFASMQIFICNVDLEPDEFDEVHSLSPAVPIVSRFHNATVVEKFLGRTKNGMLNILDKEKDDYAFCLDTAITRYDPRYVLLLEDDVLVAQNMFYVLSYLMKRSQLHARSDWLFMKLYYPTQWEGFAFEPQKLLELVAIGMIGGTFSLAVSRCLRCRMPRSNRRHLSTWWFAVGAAYATLLCSAVGRQYILVFWRSYLVSMHRVTHAPGCCTPAVFYRADFLSNLTSHLRIVRCSETYPLDAALDHYAIGRGLLRYMVDPGIVVHIGRMSSVHDHKAPEYYLL